MGVAGEPIEHLSDLTKVPGRIIERRMVQVFSLRTLLVEERYEMVHYAEPGKKPKWGYVPSEGHPEVVNKRALKLLPSSCRQLVTKFIKERDLWLSPSMVDRYGNDHFKKHFTQLS